MAYLARMAPLSQWEPVFARRDLWARVDTEACKRAAQCRILLVEFCRVPAPQWPFGETELSLLNEILTEGWGMHQSNPGATRAFFAAETDVLRELQAADIGPRAQELVRYLRPRWFTNRVFWSRFLEATTRADDKALAQIRIMGQQFRES